MTGSPEGRPWKGDVNEVVVEEWKDDTTAFDRVRQVIDVTTEPQAVGTIAERARVSDPTARKYLGVMGETGRVKTVETDSGTMYMRSPQMMAMRRISAIHREHTREEIRGAIKSLKEQLDRFREKYDVADVDELALALDAGDDGWQNVARWQQLEENLEIAQAALSLYDFDPDDSHTAAARASGQSELADSETRGRGALGDEDTRSAA